MIKKNGNDKVQFDPIGFINLMIAIVLFFGAFFSFYLTAIDGRFDELEKNDVKQTQQILYIREAVARIEK